VTTIGMRQNNPGNLDETIVNGQKTSWIERAWRGEEISANRFARFNCPLNGLRALLITLHSYLTKDGCATVGDVVNRWAPRVENNTQAYIDDVCEYVIKNYTGPEFAWEEGTLLKPTSDDLIPLGQALVHHENGEQPYTDYQWNAAWKATGL
jgi:hypothetical protein